MNATPTSTESNSHRVYVGRLSGTDVFDPIGEKVGKVHDVVVAVRFRSMPNVIGLVVEISPRRTVFLPFTRVTSIKPGAVITTGLLNLRRFTQRPAESLVITDLFDRVVTLNKGNVPVRILDVGMDERRPRDWVLNQLYVLPQTSSPAIFRRKDEGFIVSITDVSGLFNQNITNRGAAVIRHTEGMKPADVADFMHDLPSDRQLEIAQDLSDERLADVLEELGDDDRVQIISEMDPGRAANVLDVMQPDDAADLVSELPRALGEALLTRMLPDEAEDVRRLMVYPERTAGSLMTSEPVILGPGATVAEMLANVRRKDLPASLASVVCITHPPQETPTGYFLGVVYIQQALREPPQTALGIIVDSDIETVTPSTHLATVTRILATYNLSIVPVVDDSGALLGAVSVDDVLDELLPEDWRDYDDHVTDELMKRAIDG